VTVKNQKDGCLHYGRPIIGGRQVVGLFSVWTWADEQRAAGSRAGPRLAAIGGPAAVVP
jgi:hypothetical protein